MKKIDDPPLIPLLVGAAMLTACGPVGILDDDADDWKPAPGRTDRIEAVDLVSLSTTPPEAPDAAMEQMLASDIPIREPEEIRPLGIARIRRAVLENNLDLRTELVSPLISAAEFSGEQAKFESTFFAGYTRNDQGVATNLEQGDPTSSDEFLAGLRLPLATGGALSIDTLATRTDLGGTAGLLGPIEDWQSNVRFSIAQPLLRNAGVDANTASIRIAGWNRDLTDARLKLAATRILADADRAYWNLYAAWRELEVRKSQYELAVNQLDRARRRLDAGDAPEIDVVRARSGVGRTLESIIRADADLRRRQRTIKRIMNQEDLPIGGPTGLRPSTEPNPLRIELDGGELARQAVANRMEMLELELQLAVDAVTIDLRRNQALPIFAFDYRYSIQGDDSGFGKAYAALGDSDSHRIGVSGEIPIGNQVRESRLTAAVLQRVQRLATRAARSIAIENEVFDALDRLTQSWQSIIAARLETVLATRTLEGEQRQFEVGLRTSTDVLDAQSRLADAQSREVRSLADYQIALVDIAFATGTLLGRARVEFIEADDAVEVQMVLPEALRDEATARDSRALDPRGGNTP